MLWLLRRWELILRTKVRAEAQRQHRNASIESFTEDRIRVMSPGTGEIITLDREYAGSSIVDPTIGEMIWIPAVGDRTRSATPVQTPAPPPVKRPTPPTPPPQAFVLKLDETPTKKKGKK